MFSLRRPFVHGLFVSWGATGWRFVINSRTNIHVAIDCSTVLPLVLGVVTKETAYQWVCGTGSWYRNWYQYWGHCCLINDLGSSPQPEGCGELPRSLMRQQWPKLRYQFLFYHDETKLIMNKQRYRQFKCPKVSQNCPWLQHGYMCTSWGHVTWLFLLGNRCSNHCDVTVRYVTRNSNCTLNQTRQQNIYYHSWETDQN